MTPTRLLFVGNSYTSRNDLPRLVAALAAAAETPRIVETAMIVAGGASLKRHWNRGRVQQALEASPWDHVVLQEQSTLPVKNRVRHHENVRLFVDPIRRRGARMALYVVWARANAPHTQRDLDTAAAEIAAECDASVVPVGAAWASVLRERPDVALFEADGSHPTAAGSYLAACTFAERLLDVRVRGHAVSDRLKLDRDVASYLQAVAAINA